MVKKIHSLSDVLDVVDRIIVENHISIVELEKQAGISVGLISRWKKNSYDPKLEYVLRILYYLNVTLFFNSELLSCKVPIHSQNDVLDFIEQVRFNMNIPIGKLENDTGFSTGLISRWKKSASQLRFTNILTILDYLNITMLLDDSYNIDDEIRDTVNLLLSSNVTVLGKRLIIETMKQQIDKSANFTNVERRSL